MEKCAACEKAKTYLEQNNVEFTIVKLDNPIAEVGTRFLFNDKIYAPFLFHPTEGLYIFQGEPLKVYRVRPK